MQIWIVLCIIQLSFVCEWQVWGQWNMPQLLRGHILERDRRDQCDHLSTMSSEFLFAHCQLDMLYNLGVSQHFFYLGAILWSFSIRHMLGIIIYKIR